MFKLKTLVTHLVWGIKLYSPFSSARFFSHSRLSKERSSSLMCLPSARRGGPCLRVIVNGTATGGALASGGIAGAS